MEKVVFFERDSFTDYVIQKYDLQVKNEYHFEIPQIDKSQLEKENWNILCILGSSGAGKTTIIKSLGTLEEPIYDYGKSIISQFPNKTVEEVIDVFFSIGLSSVPLWLHKPNELSNGERARLDIAYKLLTNKDCYILVDEFTSVVNRTTAKTMSYNLQRYVRKNNIKIVLCSCHYDILEWLQPYYVFNLNKKINGQVLLEKVTYGNTSEYPMIDKKDLLTKEEKVAL